MAYVKVGEEKMPGSQPLGGQDLDTFADDLAKVIAEYLSGRAAFEA